MYNGVLCSFKATNFYWPLLRSSMHTLIKNTSQQDCGKGKKTELFKSVHV